MQAANRIPLYFNYIENTLPHLLDAAIRSVEGHPRLDVRVKRWDTPRPFTHCLNTILEDVGDAPCWFFMHYDAEVIDHTIIDKMIETFDRDRNSIASVSACNIFDLLALYNTKLIRRLGGWDTNLKNSYMELDLHERILKNKMKHVVLESNDCPRAMIHKDASSLRNPTKDGNIYHVYKKSYLEDIEYYHKKYQLKQDENMVEEWKKHMIAF